MTQMILVLPLPPSTNTIWRKMGNKIVKSADYNDFLDKVGWKCKEKRIEPIEGEIAAEVTFYFSRKNGDADNRLKALFDSLQGFAYANDSQVVECCYKRKIDKTDPRVEVSLWVLTK